MAVKAAIHVTDVSHLDQVNDPAASFSSLYATRLPNGIISIGLGAMVTKDNIPIIFHDNFIVSAENGQVVEKRVTDLTVDEFFSYGPQRTSGQVGKSLLRQINGNILKFDDYVVYEEEYLIHVLQVILKVVYENAQERPVLFSTFQPDVALLMKKLQHTYPVYFLTNGGNEIYDDVRMNSLEEAKKLALEGGLDGIVSEVKGIFRNPSVVREIKESNLSLLTYGKLNNVPEAVHVQYLMGVEGVIVDLVQEITSAVQAYSNSNKTVTGEEGGLKVMDNTNKIELSFLLSLVSQLAMWRIKDWVDNERDGVPFVIYWIFNCTWKRVESATILEFYHQWLVECLKFEPYESLAAAFGCKEDEVVRMKRKQFMLRLRREKEVGKLAVTGSSFRNSKEPFEL
ncbi:glycerophosphodiester phosphodiesterase GDPD1, chloroplastic-like protein [Tanacetum coccineum]|uniref:glycerophosphodiester phosphodiesterase n=1 Tax=Tanacetum coccineum TaxID=301880 RepID=A0ABQ5CUI2_9ASTR